MSNEKIPTPEYSFENFDDFDMYLEAYAITPLELKQMPALLDFVPTMVPRVLRFTEDYYSFIESDDAQSAADRRKTQQLNHGIMEQLRAIPAMIVAVNATPVPSSENGASDEDQAQDLMMRMYKETVRSQFQQLPKEVLYRMLCTDFDSDLNLRVFADNLVDAKFSPELTDELLHRFHFELQETPRMTIDRVFDLFRMDISEEKSEDEEDEETEDDPDKLVAVGPERKAMATVIRHVLLYKDALLYQQLKDGVNVFTQANWDIDKMNPTAIGVLPFIEEVSRHSIEDAEFFNDMTENWQRMLHEQHGTDEEAAQWARFVEQLRQIDIRKPEWKEFIAWVKLIEDMNKKGISIDLITKELEHSDNEKPPTDPFRSAKPSETETNDLTPVYGDEGHQVKISEYTDAEMFAFIKKNMNEPFYQRVFDQAKDNQGELTDSQRKIIRVNMTVRAFLAAQNSPDA